MAHQLHRRSHLTHSRVMQRLPVMPVSAFSRDACICPASPGTSCSHSKLPQALFKTISWCAEWRSHV